MFRKLIVCLLTFLMLMTATVAIVDLSIGTVSADSSSGGYNYTLINGGTAVKITGYTGPGGNVTIPSVLGGEPVTKIGDNAFYNHNNGNPNYGMDINSVSIPDSVTSIGNSSFSGCDLSYVSIPDSVTSIGNSAFQYSYLESVSIPDSVTSIGNSAFDNSMLYTITIGRGVTSIGEYAFGDDDSRTSVTFLGLVAPTSVGNNWFYRYDSSVVGHAYATSNFPAPGQTFYGLTMGSYYTGTNTTTVPGVPTGLTAVPGNTQVMLNWTAPSNNGGAAVDYYLIYENGNLLATHYTSTSTTITGLTNRQSYSFTVAAHNSAGIGAATSAVSVTPSSSATNVLVPGPVTNVKVTLGVNKITLDWTSPSTGGTPSTIMVFISTSNSMPSTPIANLSSSATEYVDSNVVNGTTYYCWIVPSNSAGTGVSAASGA